jgi:hypothetical protein
MTMGTKVVYTYDDGRKEITEIIAEYGNVRGIRLKNDKTINNKLITFYSHSIPKNIQILN